MITALVTTQIIPSFPRLVNTQPDLRQPTRGTRRPWLGKATARGGGCRHPPHRPGDPFTVLGMGTGRIGAGFLLSVSLTLSPPRLQKPPSLQGGYSNLSNYVPSFQLSYFCYFFTQCGGSPTIAYTRKLNSELGPKMSKEVTKVTMFHRLNTAGV